MQKLFILLCLFSLVQLNGQSAFQKEFPCKATPKEYREYPAGTFEQATMNSLVIPVVFHVIHQGGPENLRKELIHERLEKLNADFALTNPLFAQTPAAFQQVASAVDIEFRLATKDPDGNCTNGINRVYTPLSNFYIDQNLENSLHAQQLSELAQWNPQSYLNIYIFDRIYQKMASSGSFLHGIATFPEDDNTFEGIYLSDNRFQTNSNYTTLTHEVGHWLGLYHLWGAGGCSGTDFVDDTPHQYWASNICPDEAPLVTCPNEPGGNMFSNFMDYGDCRTHFTAGQAARIFQTIENDPDKLLLTSPENLVATGTDDAAQSNCVSVPEADFSTEDLYIHRCAPDVSIQFNERVTAAEGATLLWAFPGGNPATSTEAAPTVVYPASGNYSVMLTVSDANGTADISRTIEVYAYNETVEYNALHKAETFENINSLAEVGYSYNIFGENNWSLNTDYAYSGSNSMSLLNYGEETDKRCYFYTQKFDMENIGSGALHFNVAYSDELSFEGDIFHITAYANCFGGRALVASFNGEELASVAAQGGAFFPDGQGEWKHVEIPLAGYLFNYDDLQFEFIFDTFGANNIFIDDISIGALSSSLPESKDISGWDIYPNPATTSVFIKAAGKNFSWTCYDLGGRKILEQQISGNNALDIQRLESGIYFCQLTNKQSGAVTEFKKLVVVK